MTETEHLLTCLMEECAEVAQRASKALRFGLSEIQPEQSLTNAQRLVAEINDLVAVVDMLHERELIVDTLSRECVEEKKQKILRFMEYARECGTLGVV